MFRRVEDWVAVYGELRGKFSCTPDEAKEWFNFDMKPGAKGIVFQVRNGKQVIQSLVPRKFLPTVKMQKVWSRMRFLNLIARELSEIIYKCWHPLAMECNKYSGIDFFIGENAKRIGVSLCWDRLKITLGPVKPLKVGVVKFARNILKVRLCSRTCEVSLIGICTWEPKKSRFRWIGEKESNIPGNLYFKFGYCLTSPLYVYVYKREGNSYSPSVCKIGVHGKVYKFKSLKKGV